MRQIILLCSLIAVFTVCSAQDDAGKCPKYEVYKSCGTACQATCNYRYPPCNKPCVKGCFCQQGYIRKYNGGPCIKIEYCPDSPCNGDPHAQWEKQPYPCEPTCQYPYSPSPDNCHKKQKPWDCRCKIGYIRNEVNNKCVKYKDCP